MGVGRWKVRDVQVYERQGVTAVDDVRQPLKRVARDATPCWALFIPFMEKSERRGRGLYPIMRGATCAALAVRMREHVAVWMIVAKYGCAVGTTGELREKRVFFVEPNRSALPIDHVHGKAPCDAIAGDRGLSCGPRFGRVDREAPKADACQHCQGVAQRRQQAESRCDASR